MLYYNIFGIFGIVIIKYKHRHLSWIHRRASFGVKKNCALRAISGWALKPISEKPYVAHVAICNLMFINIDLGFSG